MTIFCHSSLSLNDDESAAGSAFDVEELEVSVGVLDLIEIEVGEDDIEVPDEWLLSCIS